MNQKKLFIQENSSDKALNHAVQGEFLQSEEWRKFQEAVGHRIFCISDNNFYASIIEHQLPIVGRYFYVPRGPIIENPKSEILNPKQYQNSNFKFQNSLSELINLVRENKARWIRIEPENSRILDLIRENWRVVKAPHDMQSREILVMDIIKSEEELLAGMKPKTRYNIRLAEKKGVRIRIMNYELGIKNDDIDKFVDLVKITAQRDKITPHPESYYRKMLETIPAENLKLYVAEYNDKRIAANIIIHYGNTATYLHGASDNEFRNVMAPYLLQWQAILDAKKAGLIKYDFGGIKTGDIKHETCDKNSWEGITRFKTGFAPDTKPIEFPGSYDIILNSSKYKLYKIFQVLKGLV